MKNLILIASLLFIGCQAQKPLSPRFNHVVIQVSNLDSSIGFYTQAFDLTITNRIEKAMVSDSAGHKNERKLSIAFLKFSGQDFVYEMVEVPNLKLNQAPGYFHHIGIDVEDIDQALQRVLAAGARLVRPIETVELEGMSTKHCFLKGPDGEIFELMQILSGEF